MESTSPPAVFRPSERDIAMAAHWADFFRFKGYQPLPSDPTPHDRGGRKKPLVRFAEYWEADAPADLFARRPTSNVQVMTGRHWGLLVIDLDGQAAIDRWSELFPFCPRTWTTHSGGGGRHLWFSIPRDLAPLPKARLWGEWDSTARDGRGDWSPRKNIERLCDRSLVMAPPSIHPKTGRRYQFMAGCSPREIPLPVACPAYVLAMQPLQAPRKEEPAYVPIARKAPDRPAEGWYDWREVLSVIPDKAALARSWGLRIADGRANQDGWCRTHAIGREDRNPSASFHPETGRYWEPDLGCIGFFEVGVRLGAYLDWRDARNDLGDTFALGRRRGA